MRFGLPEDENTRKYLLSGGIIVLPLSILLLGYIIFSSYQDARQRQGELVNPPQTSQDESTEPIQEEVLQIAEVGTSVTVVLKSQNDSGEEGTVVITKRARVFTTFFINMSNFPADEPQPVHIHHGTCDNFGEVIREFGTIVNGRYPNPFGRDIYVDFDGELMSEYLPWAWDVHGSRGIVSCGDFTTSDVPR